MILTGGDWDKKEVMEYREDGSRTVLPALNNGRNSHGCSSFIDSNYNTVSIMSVL